MTAICSVLETAVCKVKNRGGSKGVSARTQDSRQQVLLAVPLRRLHHRQLLLSQKRLGSEGILPIEGRRRGVGPGVTSRDPLLPPRQAAGRGASGDQSQHCWQGRFRAGEGVGYAIEGIRGGGEAFMPSLFGELVALAEVRARKPSYPPIPGPSSGGARRRDRGAGRARCGARKQRTDALGQLKHCGARRACPKP